MSIASIKGGIRTFSTGYFGLPMSTGIISIASYSLGYHQVAKLLFDLNIGILIVLSILFISRLIFYFGDLKRELSTHHTGAAFLCIVAALCILGTANILMKGKYGIAVELWYVSLGIEVVLVYAFFMLILLKFHKPGLREGITGSWLLMVVSLQALSILGNLIITHHRVSSSFLFYSTLGFFVLGTLFYFIIITLIFYRFAFLPMKPEEFHPSFWINMGAAAISTLSGCILIKTAQHFPEYENFIPVLKVFTLLFWIGGTFWIPIVGLLEIWKRIRIKIKYSSAYWSLVFPLGVYTECTWQLAEVFNLGGLKIVPQAFIFLAWISWLGTFIKMGMKISTGFKSQFE